MLAHHRLDAHAHQPCQPHRLTLQPACAPPRRPSRLLDLAVVKHEGHIKQVRPEVTACAPQGAIPQPHNTQDRLGALR